MFGMSFGEMLLIGVLALIIVGPKQLPELAKYLGRILNDLKRTTDDFTSDLKNQAKIDFDWESRSQQKSQGRGGGERIDAQSVENQPQLDSGDEHPDTVKTTMNPDNSKHTSNQTKPSHES